MMSEWAEEEWALFNEEHAEEWRRDAYYEKHPEEVFNENEVNEEDEEYYDE